MTSRHANLLGLYRLSVHDVRYETGLGVKAIERGYAAADEANFARFDAATGFVWVLNMARFRLGMKAGDTLNPKDHKVVAVNRIYHALDANPFLGQFYDANHRILRIQKRREAVGVVVPFSEYTTGRDLEGAYKPDPDSEAEAGTRVQIQKQKKARLAPPGPHDDDSPKRNTRVIRALIRTVLKTAPADAGFADLKDLAKEACAAKHLAYDADVVGSALEQALALRSQAS